MLPERISVKFFIQNPEQVDLSKLVAVFQRWIQQNTVGGMLIDVADYAHVPNGPGVLLIGHEGDYSLDASEGRYGFIYKRKRLLTGNLVERLQTVLQFVTQGSQALEAESSLGFKVSYNTLEVTFLDRLNTPNTAETFDMLQADLESFFHALYGDDVQITRLENDPRESFQVRIATPNQFTPETLLNNLERLKEPAI